MGMAHAELTGSDWSSTVERLGGAGFLEQEARALLTRLDRLQPYSTRMPMVASAAISPQAMTAIEDHMAQARRKLRSMVGDYLIWLRGHDGRRASPAEAQRRFTFLRLRFISLISQFDIFADVVSQRSEHETGVWVAGLDDLAHDHVADLVGGDAGLVEGALDRDTSEVGGREVLEPAEQAPDRRTSGASSRS